MDNIRGISDIQQGLLGSNDRNSALLFSGFRLGTAQEARNETFAGFLKSYFGPFVQKKSFTTAICAVNVVMFIICCIYDTKQGSFLEPSTECLILFGARENDKLRQYQIWRWLTAIILHSSFPHILLNLFFIFVFVSRFEFGLERNFCIFVYFLTGFLANLGGSLFSSDISVGASTSIFGIIGANIGWIIVNWTALGSSPLKMYGLVSLSITALFSIVFGLVGNNTDNIGHLIGLLSGVVCAFAFCQRTNQMNVRDKLYSNIAKGLIALFIVVGLMKFYSVI